MGINKETQEAIDKDMEENPELYEGLADTPDKWKAAEKKPVRVSYRGPYFDTDEIETIEGDYEIHEKYLEEHDGYVIIEGVQGEKYPCALDIFKETYRTI